MKFLVIVIVAMVIAATECGVYRQRPSDYNSDEISIGRQSYGESRNKYRGSYSEKLYDEDEDNDDPQTRLKNNKVYAKSSSTASNRKVIYREGLYDGDDSQDDGSVDSVENYQVYGKTGSVDKVKYLDEEKIVGEPDDDIEAVVSIQKDKSYGKSALVRGHDDAYDESGDEIAVIAGKNKGNKKTSSLIDQEKDGYRKESYDEDEEDDNEEDDEEDNSNNSRYGENEDKSLIRVKESIDYEKSGSKNSRNNAIYRQELDDEDEDDMDEETDGGYKKNNISKGYGESNSKKSVLHQVDYRRPSYPY